VVAPQKLPRGSFFLPEMHGLSRSRVNIAGTLRAAARSNTGCGKTAADTRIAMNRTSLADTVSDFIDVQYTDEEREFTSRLMRRLEQDFKKDRTITKCDCIQHLIFVDLLGQHTAWADFSVLEVMASDDYSAKRIAYTASSQLWTANSDVVPMATNRVQRDLTSSKPLVVLSSIPPYLSLRLAQHIANDVIKLMTSSKDFVQVKAIMSFYHICLHYPDAADAARQRPPGCAACDADSDA
jgi:hypothetical protein